VTAPGPLSSPAEPGVPVLPVLADRRPGPGRCAGFVLLFLTAAAGLAVFSALPWAATRPGVAMLKVAFKHVSASAETGAALSREELEKLPRHMRPQGGQSGTTGTRRDTIVRVMLDGRPILERTYRPSGLRHDGPTFVYEELSVPLGRHVLEAALVETAAPAGSATTLPPERRIVADVEVEAGQVFLLELSNQQALALRQGGRSLATELR
jgi:hypothetical protein